MTNYADYPTTARFWQLVEELGIEKPYPCDFVWYDENVNYGLHVAPRIAYNHGIYQQAALDLNALLSWEWLTKPRSGTILDVDTSAPVIINGIFAAYYLGQGHGWAVDHQEDYKGENYSCIGYTGYNDNLAQAITEYAISLMEYERGEK